MARITIERWPDDITIEEPETVEEWTDLTYEEAFLKMAEFAKDHPDSIFDKEPLMLFDGNLNIEMDND